MMHYRKGENIEQEITKADLPFSDCMPADTKDFLWMHVKGGTKVNNVIPYAKNELEKGDYRTVVWSGSGGGIVKTISCAEILKRSLPLYQVTRMCYTNVEEHWKPQMDGLEEIIANRQIPCIHILMSLDVIDDTVNGLQKPNTKTNFWIEPNTTAQRHDNNRPRQQQQQSRSGQNQRKRQTKQQQQPKHEVTAQDQQNRPQGEEQENRHPIKTKNFNKSTNGNRPQYQQKQQQQQPQNSLKQKQQKQSDQSNDEKTAHATTSNSVKAMES